LVVLCDDGGKVYTSADCKTWTLQITLGGAANDVVYAAGLFLCATAVGIYWSTDGVTWTISDMAVACTTIASNGNLLVAGASAATYTSLDGKTWTTGAASGMTKILYGANVFVGYSAAGLSWSTDGVTWTAITLAFTYATPTLFVFINNLFLLSYGQTGLTYSTDGKIWTAASINSGAFKSINYGNELFEASSDEGLYFSTDGIVWDKIDQTMFYSLAQVDDYVESLFMPDSSTYEFAKIDMSTGGGGNAGYGDGGDGRWAAWQNGEDGGLGAGGGGGLIGGAGGPAGLVLQKLT
jgi:hypothetical protein